MHRHAIRIMAWFASAAVLSQSLAAQQGSTAGAVTAEYRAALAEKLTDELARGYVLPDVGAAMALRIRTKLHAGVYDSLPTPRALAIALARDIDTVAHDQHLGIALRAPSPPSGGENRGREQRSSSPPSAIAEVKVLPGNVGYIKLDEFPVPADFAPTLDRAMQTVARTDALILDLRTNRGGSGDGMLYLAGYFFAQPTLIAQLYSREDDSTTEMRSARVNGPRYLDKPLYVLTSRRTFSAGEAAAYHLKYSAHATTVGDTTGGGAHRIRGVDLNDDFTLRLPYTRVINAVTKRDWEGVGVIPEIACSSESALAVAERAALTRLPATPERAAALRALEPVDSHPTARVAAGLLEARVLYDSSYRRPRRIWIYTPAGYDAHRANAYPLIVAFDGDEYRDTMPLPMVLDTLLATHRAPPFVAVLIDDSIGPTRIDDLGNAARMPQFLAKQVIPYVQRGWHVTHDPHRVIVTGSSAGGLGAAYVAFVHPELFGNVWSQSGAFWRGAEASNDAPYEWLTQQVKASPRKDIRFHLDVGELEDHPTLGGAGPNFRDANRRLRDALKAKGYAVTYAEVPNGNHGPEWWRSRLATGSSRRARDGAMHQGRDRLNDPGSSCPEAERHRSLRTGPGTTAN